MPPIIPDTTLSRRVIGCAIEVHTHLGPGLTASVYETCLCEELSAAGLAFARRRSLPVRYKNKTLDAFFQIDVVVAETLALEIMAVDQILPPDEARLLTYLRLSGYGLGLLLNFNANRLTEGLRRVASTMDRIDEVWTTEREPVWRGRTA